MPLPRLNGRTQDPRRDPTSIGNLAISKGYATQSQVELAIRKQEERSPLGKILVEQGVLTESQLDELLIEQEVSRRRLHVRAEAKLWKKHRRQRFGEVVKGLQDVVMSLNLASK